MAITQSEPNPWRETPLIESTVLSKAAGCRIFLKLEHLQPSGSFKSRGIGHLCGAALRRAADPRRVHFYSSSGGNAGLACVYAANFLARPSTVCVPLSTKQTMVAKIRAAGASAVLQHGASWKEADAYLREVVMRRAEADGDEAVYVPPFDHEDIWAGNATVVDEIAWQMKGLGAGVPDVLVCSVGGGGLFNGLVEGVTTRGSKWERTQVLAMETDGADSLAQSVARGELVTLPAITSLATSLGATRVSRRTFDLAMKHRDDGRVKHAVLSDGEAAMGCWRFADDERIIVELACGVNLALCYGGRLERALGRAVREDEKVVIVVCGGSNVNTGMLVGWKELFGDLDLHANGANGHVSPNAS